MISPDGEWYAISFNGRILLRPTVDPHRYRILDYGALTHILAFSADSKIFAAGGSTGNVILWECASGHKIQEFDSKIRFWLVNSNGRPSGPAPAAFTVEQICFSPLDSKFARCAHG
jgi:WD40 repeat protein